ncbi:glucose PTS transporter subunit IIA, partial [Providencia sp.]
NIVNIDACITRLRLTVKDSSVVNDAMTKRLGAAGVIRLNKQNVQVIVGTRAELVAKAMTDVIAKGPIAASAPVAAAAVAAVKASEPAKAKGNIVLSLVAPVSGQVYSLDDVPDEAFSSRIVGDGIAIKPTSSEVLAPASGTVVKIFETNHAFCLETENGVELIVHMGIDTVALKGEGCSRLVEEGAEVEAGTPILNLDLPFLEANAKSMISPVIISNIDDFAGVEILVEGEVIAGKTVIYNVLK